MTHPSLRVHHGGRPAPGPRTRRIVVGVAALAFLALVGVPWLASFATDWLWFREIHFESVFLTSLVARALLFVGLGAFAFAFLYANLRWARPRSRDVLTLVRAPRGRRMRVDLTSLVPKLLLAALARGRLHRRRRRLGAVDDCSHGDPRRAGRRRRLRCFGRDIGFYLFQLPAISAALGALVVLTTLSLAGVVAALCPARRGRAAARRASVEPAAARHVGALLVLLLLLFAAQLWIVDSASLLYSNTGPLAGASYADVHVLASGHSHLRRRGAARGRSRGVRRAAAEARLVRGPRRSRRTPA